MADAIDLDPVALAAGREEPHPRASVFLLHSGEYQEFSHDQDGSPLALVIDRDETDALERALAFILPGGDDWRAATSTRRGS